MSNECDEFDETDAKHHSIYKSLIQKRIIGITAIISDSTIFPTIVEENLPLYNENLIPKFFIEFIVSLDAEKASMLYNLIHKIDYRSDTSDHLLDIVAQHERKLQIKLRENSKKED